MNKTEWADKPLTKWVENVVVKKSQRALYEENTEQVTKGLEVKPFYDSDFTMGVFLLLRARRIICIHHSSYFGYVRCMVCCLKPLFKWICLNRVFSR